MWRGLAWQNNSPSFSSLLHLPPLSFLAHGLPSCQPHDPSQDGLVSPLKPQISFHVSWSFEHYGLLITSLYPSMPSSMTFLILESIISSTCNNHFSTMPWKEESQITMKNHKSPKLSSVWTRSFTVRKTRVLDRQPIGNWLQCGSNANYVWYSTILIHELFIEAAPHERAIGVVDILLCKRVE